MKRYTKKTYVKKRLSLPIEAFIIRKKRVSVPFINEFFTSETDARSKFEDLCVSLGMTLLWQDYELVRVEIRKL